MKPVLVGMVCSTLLFACSTDSDDEEASTCDALQGLATSVSDLVNLDLVAEGSDGLNAALDDVESAWQSVGSDSDDQFGPEVQALVDSVDSVVTTVESFGDSETLEAGVTEVAAAIDDVAAAWNSLETEAESELADCDLSAS